jgi:Cdc6-like AAA superfamily ATPase
MSDRISSRHHRAEYTCEWATEHLTDFARSKDHVLLITGKEHSGKSVLAGWIADRMRNTKGRLAHEVVSFSIDAALKDQMTPLAVLQGLVLQVFDTNVGDLSLFRAIVSAQRASKAGRPTSEVEDALWGALDAGFRESGKLMIVVDGIDQFGESTSLQFLERLQTICSKHEPIKAVALS